MQTKIEGIVLSKNLFKERNIVAHILLRNGEKCSVLFYGGAGGGAKKKSSLLEVGYLLKIELRPSHKYGGENNLVIAKEWSLIWSADKIRYSYPSFLLSCFFLEICQKVSPELSTFKDLRNDSSGEGAFRVLSNALYCLNTDQDEKGKSDLDLHLALFLAKILAEMGLYPAYRECLFCASTFFEAGPTSDRLVANAPGLLHLDKGGVSCALCAERGLGHVDSAVQIHWPKFFHVIWHQKYPELLKRFKEEIALGENEFKLISQILLKYFKFHTQVEGPCVWALQQEEFQAH